MDVEITGVDRRSDQLQRLLIKVILGRSGSYWQSEGHVGNGDRGILPRQERTHLSRCLGRGFLLDGLQLARGQPATLLNGDHAPARVEVSAVRSVQVVCDGSGGFADRGAVDALALVDRLPVELRVHYGLLQCLRLFGGCQASD